MVSIICSIYTHNSSRCMAAEQKATSEVSPYRAVSLQTWKGTEAMHYSVLIGKRPIRVLTAVCCAFEIHAYCFQAWKVLDMPVRALL